MDRQKSKLSPLAEVELEALEAGREWIRNRIEKNLQKLADEQGDVSPPEQSSSSSFALDNNPSDNERGRSKN